MQQLLTGILWDLFIDQLTPAVAVAAIAYVACRGLPHLQRLFGTESHAKTTRQLAWARSWAGSFAIFGNIAISLIFLRNVYFAAYRMLEHPARSDEYLTYIIGIIVSGAFVGFAFYLAEWRAFLRRDAKDVTV
jgi:hypothetical protein